MVRNCVALISWLQLKFVLVSLALKCLKIQTLRDYCHFISGRCRYTECASFYSNVATFETRAGRVRSNKIEVNVYFLTSRQQRVVIEGQASDWLSVTSGVPQGSILRPLLFLAYVNDLPYSVTCNSDLFADNTVLHRHLENRSDCDLLQEDLTSASEWCKSWLVTLKTEKCEVYTLHGRKIQ